MTAEACSLVSGNTYRITSSARRVIDPEAQFNVLDTAVTVPFSNIAAIDFQFGEVTFVAPPSGAVTVTGKFLPLTTASEIVTEAKSFTLTESVDVMDQTVFSSSAFKKKKRGLGDMNVSVTLYSNATDLVTMDSYLSNGTLVCMEILLGVDPRFRGFGRITNIERSGSVDGLIEATVSFTLSAERNENSGFFAGYSNKTLA